MKAKFRRTWNASAQPRKQRKYLANAPLHIKRKFLNVQLSKELRKKYGKRNIGLRKNDTVKIMVGKFKKQSGKVLSVNTKFGKITIEGIQKKKMDGSKVAVPIRASNLMITNLELNDKKRITKLSGKKTEEKIESKKEDIKKTDKTEIKEKNIKNVLKEENKK